MKVTFLVVTLLVLCIKLIDVSELDKQKPTKQEMDIEFTRSS